MLLVHFHANRISEYENTTQFPLQGKIHMFPCFSLRKTVSDSIGTIECMISTVFSRIKYKTRPCDKAWVSASCKGDAGNELLGVVVDVPLRDKSFQWFA